jgi:integrase/recombinase XerC
MKQLVPISSPALPTLVIAAGERARMRFLEFFTANIRNAHTRRTYARAGGHCVGCYLNNAKVERSANIKKS